MIKEVLARCVLTTNLLLISLLILIDTYSVEIK